MLTTFRDSAAVTMESSVDSERSATWIRSVYVGVERGPRTVSPARFWRCLKRSLSCSQSRWGFHAVAVRSVPQVDLLGAASWGGVSLGGSTGRRCITQG